MNAGTARAPEDGIPVLTEVIQWPGALEGTAPTERTQAAADELAEQLQRDVLQRLRAPEFGLEAELMEHLRPMVERASRRFAAELSAQLQATLSYVTETVVERAVGEVLAARDAPSAAQPSPGAPRHPATGD